MKYQVQLSFIEKIAAQILRKAMPVCLSYHDFQHTFEVVQAAEIIGRACHLSEAEVQLVKIAAWLHDLGHTKTYTGHETESKTIALELLCAAGMPERETAIILGCIEATRMPQRPKSLLQAVLCDADLAHLASDQYIERSQLLREEWECILDKVYTDEDWLNSCFNFINNHQYFTPYGRNVLENRKQKNISDLDPLEQELAA